MTEADNARSLFAQGGVKDQALIDRLLALAKCSRHRRPVGITGHITGPEA